jgi:regulatory protein
MAGTITALKGQPRNRARVVVYLDGLKAFGVTKVLAAGLAVGQRLTDEEIENLRHDEAEEDAYQRALRLLGLRPRSERELRSYFDRHRFAPEIQEKVLARLGELGLVDDRAFARMWVEDRQAFRPRSARALKAELRQKGVEAEAVEAALEGANDEQAAYQAALKAARRLRGLPREIFRRRLGSALARRGFDYEVIKPIVERVWVQAEGAGEESEDNQCHRH